jgi:FlgD Ig-like domain
MQDAVHRIVLALGALLALAPGIARAQDPLHPFGVAPKMHSTQNLTNAAPLAAGPKAPLPPLWAPHEAHQVTATDTLVTAAETYLGMSFSVQASTNTLADIFNELGGYDPAVWRFGHWRPDLNGYQEGTAINPVQLGLGYWLITKQPATVYFDGAVTPAETVQVVVRQGPNGAPGWNQLGNPHPFRINVNNWRVAKRDTNRTVAQAASAGWIDPNARVWNGTSYDAAGLVQRRQAFWVRAIHPDTALKWTVWKADSLTAPNVGTWCSLAYDANGTPHITYKDETNGDLRYATRNADTWTLELVDNSSANVGDQSSVKVDAQGNVHVTYADVSNAKLRYAVRNATTGTWASEDVETGLGTASFWSIFSTLHLNSSGVPRVAYSDYANNRTRFAVRTGPAAWNRETVLTNGAYWIAMAIDPQGNPHVVSQTVSRDTLKYTRRSGAGVWSSPPEILETLPFNGFTNSMAIDAAGNVHLAYYNNNNGIGDAMYGLKVGNNAFTRQTIDATGNVGAYCSLALTQNGAPRVAYADFSNGQTRFAFKNGSSWETEPVDLSPTSGQFCALALDAAGLPAIASLGVYSSSHVRFAEKTRGEVRLKIAPIAGEPQNDPLALKPAGSDWAVAITAERDGRKLEPLVLGVASTNAEALRSARTPGPPGIDVPGLWIERQRGDRMDGPYMSDFQSPGESVRWRFETNAKGPGEETLTFAGFDLPQAVRLYLTDPESGWTSEVRSGERVAVAARGRRTLELTATRGAAPSGTVLSERLAYAYPNPFGARVGFTFTVPRTADLQVAIYDVQGRQVQVIARSGATPGEHVLTWDGRDAAGHKLPSGVYLAQWQAGVARGTARIVRVE